MREFTALFSNMYIQIKAKIIFNDYDNNYIFPVIVNGIKIETYGFDNFVIRSFENYNKEQLKIFDYRINEDRDYVLKNYNLKVLIPVKIDERKTGNIYFDTMSIENSNYSKWRKFAIITNKIKLMGYEIVINTNFSDGFGELYQKMKNNYSIRLCAFCKRSAWDTSNGTEFSNLLCYNEIMNIKMYSFVIIIVIIWNKDVWCTALNRIVYASPPCSVG